MLLRSKSLLGHHQPVNNKYDMIKIISFTFCALTAFSVHAKSLDVDKQLDYCHAHVERALAGLKKNGAYDFTMEPRNILATDTQQGWNCRKNTAEEWCSGFWPGILWMDYSSSHDRNVKKAAEGYTESLAYLAGRPAYDHDLGFLMINSFLKGIEAMDGTSPQDKAKQNMYKEVALRAADTLATLFNPTVGTMLSWPRHVAADGGHNTIMDNMINLELLFWATENGGGQRLHDMAVKHAETTMQNHFRPDGSCYHVAIYDLKTGKFLRGKTHQGYADYSMWSRGQSWAIYGYTMVYRYTKDPRFLQFVQKVTDIYLRRLKETSDDFVPLWDMDDPRGVAAPKDASAACVVASALFELSRYVSGEKGRDYRKAAVKMMDDLSTPKYLSGNRNVAFLMHSTGHHPAGSEIDASIIYADYYYIEALERMRNTPSR